MQGLCWTIYTEEWGGPFQLGRAVFPFSLSEVLLWCRVCTGPFYTEEGDGSPPGRVVWPSSKCMVLPLLQGLRWTILHRRGRWPLSGRAVFPFFFSLRFSLWCRVCPEPYYTEEGGGPFRGELYVPSFSVWFSLWCRVCAEPVYSKEGAGPLQGELYGPLQHWERIYLQVGDIFLWQYFMSFCVHICILVTKIITHWQFLRETFLFIITAEV